MAVNRTTFIGQGRLMYGFLALGLSVLAALTMIQLTLPYYLILLGVLLFAFLLYHHIEIGIGLLVASMLFQKPLLPGEIELSLTRILSLPVLTVCFVKIILDQRKLIFQKYKDNMVILLFIWSAMGLLFAKDLPSLTTGLTTLLQLVFMYFIFKMVIEDEESLQKVIKVTVFAGMCIAGFTIIQILLDPDSLVYSTKMNWSDRVTGTADDPNKFAMGLVFVVPLSLYAFVTKNRWYLVATLFFYFLILSTFSRAGYLALAVITVLGLFYLNRYTNRGILFSSVLLILLGGSFLFLNQGNKVLARMQSVERYESGSIGKRMELIEVALDMGIHNPVFGVGLNNFRANSQFYGNQRHYERDAHNGFLEIFGMLGLPGFFLFMGVIFLSVRDIARFQELLNEDDDEDVDWVIFAKFLKISLFGYLIAAFFLTLIGQKLFWTLLAFSSLLDKAAELREETGADEPVTIHNPAQFSSAGKMPEHILN